MTKMYAGSVKLAGSIALAIVMGALAAASTLYERGVVSNPTIQNVEVEDWPICRSVGATRSEAEWAALDPDLAGAKRALAKGDWTSAIRALEFAAARDPRNADIQSYLGYTYLQSGQLGPAMGYFQQALLINPRHRGTHEHLGELFLTLKEPAQAEEHLAALKEVCLLECEEVGRLQRAIQDVRHVSGR